MANDTTGRERLRQFGARNVPVVAKGERFLVAKRMDQLAQFVGVPVSAHTLLPPHELIDRWIRILRAGQRYVRQVPNDQLNSNATHLRKKSMRLVCHHIFGLGDVYLECVLEGAKDLELRSRRPLEDGIFASVEEICRYGDEVIARLERWWSALPDKSCGQKLDIDDYGIISIHQLLERCTWHSAHHARQIADVLERQGIAPDGKFTVQDLAGLPMPERIWD